MQKLKFRVEESGAGHIRLQCVSHHAPGIFEGRPSGRIEFWNLNPVLSDIPVGTELTVDWPIPGEKNEQPAES